LRISLPAQSGLLAAVEAKNLHNKQLIFVGGLHKSGTSLTHRLLRAHPAVSGFVNTGAPEDEGQHLQNVYPAAKVYGGPGRFAFDERAHLTEQSSLVSTGTRTALLNDWAGYWDLSKDVLIEKSPPNLIRGRFLQALFPGAKFIFIVRHPASVSLATRKWTRQQDIELMLHWLVAHNIFLNDLAHLEHWAWLRYEDLVTKPNAILCELWDFIGLRPIPAGEPIAASFDTSSFAASSKLTRLFRGDAAAVMKQFGYQFEPPYFRLPPGEIGIVTR
jgi:hypothetical protein